MPARIPRCRNPSRIAFASYAASIYTTFGRVRSRPLPPCFTRKPPAPPPTCGGRAHSPAPPLRLMEALPDSSKRAPLALSASYAHRFLPLPPFFASICVESMAISSTHTLPRRIPPIQKSLKNLLPDSLLLKFRMPPPSGRIEYRRGLSYP